MKCLNCGCEISEEREYWFEKVVMKFCSVEGRIDMTLDELRKDNENRGVLFWRFLGMKIILALLFALILPTTAFCDVDGRLARCEPFRAAVVKILKEHGLSERFYFLMVAESGCRAKDVRSHRGAVGFWQMMPATGRAHGCSNLEDLECATRAAASYLKDLSTRFKEDEIIAAWNMGGHNFKKYGMTPEARGLIRRVKYLEEVER